jgi:hypothetical protein
MPGALSAFLDEVRALPKVRDAVAAGTVLQGNYEGIRSEAKPAAEHFADLERLFERAELDDDPLIVEIHDALAKIVSSDAPIKERFAAILACLKPYYLRFAKQ